MYINSVFPIKRQRLSDWIKKQDPNICCLQGTHLNAKIQVNEK